MAWFGFVWLTWFGCFYWVDLVDLVWLVAVLRRMLGRALPLEAFLQSKARLTLPLSLVTCWRRAAKKTHSAFDLEMRKQAHSYLYFSKFSRRSPMALLINISKNRKADINSGIVQPSMYRYIVHSVNYDQAHLISKALDIMFPHIVVWRVLRFTTKRGKIVEVVWYKWSMI